MNWKTILRIILCFSVTNTISCSHFLVDTKKPTAELDLKYEELDKTESFGFTHGKNKYYFAKTHLKNEGYHCWFFVGFKNDKFEYSFPTDRLKNLAEIYFQRLSIEDKKTQVVSEVTNFEKESRICTPETGSRQANLAEIATGGIVFIFVLPIALLSSMTFGAETAIKSVKDELLMRRMDNIRIGMSFKEIEDIMEMPLLKEKLDLYDYYYVDGQYVRLAMYFKNGQLDSFVRGWQYATQHKKKSGGQKSIRD